MRGKRFLFLLGCVLLLSAILPTFALAAIVDNGDGTHSDTFAGITVTTPITHSHCEDTAFTETISVTGLTNSGKKLIGWIESSFVLAGGGKQILETIPVNTGSDFSETLLFPPPSTWPIAHDYGNGIVTKEAHVDLALALTDLNGNFLGYTFGPGLDWDIFCTGNFPPPPPPPPGTFGCTPGYWKNHPERWIISWFKSKSLRA